MDRNDDIAIQVGQPECGRSVCYELSACEILWPYNDSMSNHFYVDEDMFASLVGRDVWDETTNNESYARPVSQGLQASV